MEYRKKLKIKVASNYILHQSMQQQCQRDTDQLISAQYLLEEYNIAG